MSKLKRLKIGDKIGMYSPSSPVTFTVPNRFKRAKSFLENKGFEVIEGNLTGKSDFYRSGSIKERAEELNELIRNPDVKCIMSSIGGMNSNSLLPYIDYEAFKNDPKIMIGYSDVTAILLAIYAKTGITTFYGPAFVASFGELEPFVEYTYRYFIDMLVTPQLLPYYLPKPPFWTDEFISWETQSESKVKKENEWVCVNSGKTRGRLIGGNLNTIQGIWGSEYMPAIQDGDILFIEDSLKDAATIERTFSMLKVNGVFDRVSGIVLGKHELFNDCGTGRKPHEVLQEVMNDIKKPILADFDCCHTHPMLTLPLGAIVEMDSGNRTISIINEWIE